MQAPAPTETDIHLALVELLQSGALISPWVFLHIPNGEKRDKKTAALLKAMGTLAGAADLLFIGPGRSILFLELKRKDGVWSKAQAEFAARVHVCGCHYHVAYSLDDAVGTLRDLGIVRASVSA